MDPLRTKFIASLRFLERYTKTDMVFIARQGPWLILSQGIAMAASLLLAVAFGHLASQDTYGNYKYVLSLWGICSAFTLSGIGTAVMQAAARGYDGTLRQGFRLNLRWSIGSIVIALGMAAYYYFFEQNLFLATSLCIVAIFSPFISSFSLFDPFLTGKKEFKRNSIYLSLNGLIPVLALIATLFVTDRAIVFIAVFFVSNLLTDAVTYALAARSAKNDTNDPGLLSYGAHLSIMGIVSALADRIDNIAMFILLGPVNLALYTFAIAIPEQIKQMVKFVTPLSLARFAERSIDEIRVTIWRRISILALIIALGILLYIVCAPLIFKILFPQYMEAVAFSQWYAPSILFAVLTTPIVSILQAHKKTRELYIISSISSVLLLVALPLGIYMYGIAGAIAAQFAYRMAAAVVTVWQFTKKQSGPGAQEPVLSSVLL